MKTFLTLFSVGLAWLVPSIHAYGIDDSCEDKILIQGAADSAINMARNALAAIQPPDGVARDPNVERLLNLLFRPSIPSSEADDAKLLQKIARVFEGATRLAGEPNIVQPSDDETVAEGVVCTPSDPSACKADVGRTSIAT
jgi:hypothetical protein